VYLTLFSRDMRHDSIGGEEWVMSHMNQSCHMWMSHVTYDSVMPRMNQSCHVEMSRMQWRVLAFFFTWHLTWLHRGGGMSHVTYESVMSYVNESCHIWISHVTYKWVGCSDVYLPLLSRDTRLTITYPVYYIQPIAFGVSFLHSQISIDDLLLYVTFTTIRWKETKEIKIGDWD